MQQEQDGNEDGRVSAVLFSVSLWSRRLQLHRSCSHVMIPKGFPSVPGGQEHNNSFSGPSFSLCAGSVVCNLWSLAIPWETASAEVRDAQTLLLLMQCNNKYTPGKQRGCVIFLVRKTSGISVIALGSLNERYYPKADTAIHLPTCFFPQVEQQDNSHPTSA